jgi:hypothetical protein
MTREYVLAPFAPKIKDPDEEGRNETWTASTTLYSLDLHCEAARLERGDPDDFSEYNYVGANDCKWPSAWLDYVGNDTIGLNSMISDRYQDVSISKEFASMYIGYWSTDWSDYYLQNRCAETANHTW